MDLQPPEFFNRGPSPLVRLLIFLLLSAALMTADACWHWMMPVRAAVSALLLPVQQTAQSPFRVVSILSDYFVDQHVLLQENRTLKTRNLQLSALGQRMALLETENARLRALLALRATSPLVAVKTAMVAEIVHADPDPFSRKLLLGRGSRDGVRAGQIGADENGVLGQVTRVLPTQAELTLVTDKTQVVPVQVLRNGLRAVVFGSGREESLEVRFLAANADIREQDVLVTSGLDGLYPPGLAVARVIKVERGGAQAFARISCLPLAAPNRFRQLLLLQPAETGVLP